MTAPRSLHIAYTPDSDDAFYYDALESGLVTLPGHELQFHRAPMSVLNRAALRGTYDVTAISSVAYPRIAHRYAILNVGTSVGRGYGPVLASKEPCTLGDLAGARVGVAGIPTTGWFLLRVFCPQAIPVTMAHDRIGPAILACELAAGVMIHEELLYYPRLGLRAVADLGAEWCRQHDLPLPVGLNVIRRDVGMPLMQRVADVLQQGLRYSLDHPQAALERVCRFGRGPEGGCTERFVAMFANADSLTMPADVRTALRVLLTQYVDLGYADVVPPLDIVEAGIVCV